MSALLVLGLIGCFDEEPITIDPPAPESIALEEGGYEVQVLAVQSLSCDGQSPAELIGQALRGHLFVEGDMVEMDLQGWMLSGTMAGGGLSLAGELSWAEPMPADDGDVVVADDPDSSDSSDSSDTSDSSGGSDGSTGEDTDGRGGGEDPSAPEEARGFLSIEASIVSSRLAAGTLALEMPGCAMDLDVAVLYVGSGGREEPPVYEEPVPEPAEECDGADCG